MDFGINIAPGATAWETVARAEALGFTDAWFIDSQLLNADLFVVMAACAMKTTRIRLGTGMLIPSNRLAPVAANALASLNKLAPGRIRFGVATGFTARRTMGQDAIRLADLAHYVETVEGLLAGRTVAWRHDGAVRPIRFLDPELDLINIADPIPTLVSALGPKIKALTARLGAGFVVPIKDVEGATAHLRAMQDEWQKAGRDPATLYAVASAGGMVLRDGEDWGSARAIDQAGPQAVMVLHDHAEAAASGKTIGLRIPPALEDAARAFGAIYEAYTPADARYLSVHKGHLMVVRPEERHLVTGEMIRTMTFSGRKDELRARIRTLRDAGYRQFSTHVRYGQPTMLDDWAEVIAGV